LKAKKRKRSKSEIGVQEDKCKVEMDDMDLGWASFWRSVLNSDRK